jgi:hypothetical protein
MSDEGDHLSKHINRNRESRDAGQLTSRTRENVSLPDLKHQLFDLQNRLYTQYFLKQHPAQQDLSVSLETIFEALNLLDPILPLFPNDFDLQELSRLLPEGLRRDLD